MKITLSLSKTRRDQPFIKQKEYQRTFSDVESIIMERDHFLIPLLGVKLFYEPEVDLWYNEEDGSWWDKIEIKQE